MPQQHFNSWPVLRVIAILATLVSLMAAGTLAAQPPAASAKTSAASRAEMAMQARLGGLKSVSVRVRTGGEGGAGMFDKNAIRAQAESALRQAGITVSDAAADPGDDEAVLSVNVRTWKPAIGDGKNYIGLVGIELMRWGRTNSPAAVDMLFASWDAGPQLMAAEGSMVARNIAEMLQPMLDRFTGDFAKANRR